MNTEDPFSVNADPTSAIPALNAAQVTDPRTPAGEKIVSKTAREHGWTRSRGAGTPYAGGRSAGRIFSFCRRCCTSAARSVEEAAGGASTAGGSDRASSSAFSNFAAVQVDDVEGAGVREVPIERVKSGAQLVGDGIVQGVNGGGGGAGLEEAVDRDGVGGEVKGGVKAGKLGGEFGGVVDEEFAFLLAGQWERRGRGHVLDKASHNSQVCQSVELPLFHVLPFDWAFRLQIVYFLIPIDYFGYICPRLTQADHIV